MRGAFGRRGGRDRHAVPLGARADEQPPPGGRGRIFDWSGLTDRFRVIRYDARGHGESDATANPDDYAYPLLGADALALATALGVDRFVAGGASMGSATALHAAVQAPERIVALCC